MEKQRDSKISFCLSAREYIPREANDCMYNARWGRKAADWAHVFSNTMSPSQRLRSDRVYMTLQPIFINQA